MVDCFSPESPIQEVALMKGNQMGATTAVLETILLYNIMCAPKAQMYVTADAGLMKTSVLVRNRTNAYTGSKRKIFWGSTPLVKQTSKIEGLYLAGDQRKFFVPCKHCGTMQELIWHGKNESGYVWGITWENNENFEPRQETVAYRCSNPDCGKTMKNYDKAVIIPKGEWRPTAKPANPSKKSYHITPIYNPPGMYSWEDMVLEWAECWDLKNNRMRDKENCRLFRNTKQGLTFEELGTRQIEYLLYFTMSIVHQTRKLVNCQTWTTTTHQSATLDFDNLSHPAVHRQKLQYFHILNLTTSLSLSL